MHSDWGSRIFFIRNIFWSNFRFIPKISIATKLFIFQQKILEPIFRQVKWQGDYLVKASPDPDMFYGQVGDGDSDHRNDVHFLPIFWQLFYHFLVTIWRFLTTFWQLVNRFWQLFEFFLAFLFDTYWQFFLITFWPFCGNFSTFFDNFLATC